MAKDEEQGQLHFTIIGGLKVYSPGACALNSPKKHRCPDCHFCQFCSDTRCQSCRSNNKKEKPDTRDKPHS